VFLGNHSVAQLACLNVCNNRGLADLPRIAIEANDTAAGLLLGCGHIPGSSEENMTERSGLFRRFARLRPRMGD
jgi:hypothetical protein